MGGLVVAASPLRDLELGLGLTGGPSSDAQAAVEAGFAPGVTAPTEVLVEAPGPPMRPRWGGCATRWPPSPGWRT